MKLAYCTECSPPQVVGAGEFPEDSKNSHRVKGAVHVCKVVDVPDLAMEPGESAEKYLKRLRMTYEGKLT